MTITGISADRLASKKKKVMVTADIKELRNLDFRAEWIGQIVTAMIDAQIKLLQNGLNTKALKTTRRINAESRPFVSVKV